MVEVLNSNESYLDKQVEEAISGFMEEEKILKDDMIDDKNQVEKPGKPNEINELEKSWNYTWDPKEKTLFFFYNITEWKKRDAEIFIKEDWENVILTIDAYNTYWRNWENSDITKSFEISQINEIPNYLKNIFQKWFDFETIFWLDENFKVNSTNLLSKIQKKAEWWIKLFEYYTKQEKQKNN